VIELNAIEKGKSVRDYDDWVYDVHGDNQVDLIVHFDKAAVVSIECITHGDGTRVGRCPSIAGIADGSSEQDVLAKFGSPDQVGLDGVTKRIRYPKLGIFFLLTKQRVYIVGVHNLRYRWGDKN
jgi:hypothetical protein